MKHLFPLGATVLLTLAFTARADDPKVPAAKAEAPQPLSVKNQIHMRYVVGGQDNERDGGWGPSDNYPKSLKEKDQFGEGGKLSIVAFPEEEHHIGKVSTIQVRIVNRTEERQFFSAIDSHLYIVQEAQNKNGEWNPIERTPHGTGPRDCAVGFHRISLKPGQYWEVSGPRYSGPFKTKMRFRLDLGRNDKQYPSPGGKIIYSNVFEGAIHPDQFARGGGTGRDLNAP